MLSVLSHVVGDSFGHGMPCSAFVCPHAWNQIQSGVVARTINFFVYFFSRFFRVFIAISDVSCCVMASVYWQVKMLTVLQRQSEQSGVLDDIDHLFLLPERALTMDSSRLQKDLAGLDFDPRLMHAAPMGNVWLCKLSF